MIKAIIFILHLLVLPQAFASEITHKILAGDLHSGGTLKIKIIEERQSDFDAEISYKIIPRLFVPISRSQREGIFIATLPIEYLDERGYEDLAQSGPTVNQGATLEHLGRVNIIGYDEAHHVRLTPSSKKWLLEAWYHPSVIATGWAQLMIELQNVPLVGKYKVYSKLSN